MKREIKFRAWDKFMKTMVYPEATMLDISFNGYIVDNGLLHDRERDFELMQFTGLLDKNGKEIWEGDLLRIPNNESIREGIHRVYYYQDGFVTSSILFTDEETANKNSLSWIIKRGAEVIGNRFETPDLL